MGFKKLKNSGIEKIKKLIEFKEGLDETLEVQCRAAENPYAVAELQEQHKEIIEKEIEGIVINLIAGARII